MNILLDDDPEPTEHDPVEYEGEIFLIEADCRACAPGGLVGAIIGRGAVFRRNVRTAQPWLTSSLEWTNRTKRFDPYPGE